MIKQEKYHATAAPDLSHLFDDEPSFASILKQEAWVNEPRDKYGKWTKEGKVIAGWYKTKGGHHLQVDETGKVIYGGKQSEGKQADPSFIAAGPFQSKEEAHAHQLAPAPNPATMSSAQLEKEVSDSLQSKPEGKLPEVSSDGGETWHIAGSKPVPVVAPEIKWEDKTKGALQTAKNKINYILHGKISKESSELDPNTGHPISKFQATFFSTQKAKNQQLAAENKLKNAGFYPPEEVKDHAPGAVQGYYQIYQKNSMLMVRVEHVPPAEPKTGNLSPVMLEPWEKAKTKEVSIPTDKEGWQTFYGASLGDAAVKKVHAAMKEANAAYDFTSTTVERKLNPSNGVVQSVYQHNFIAPKEITEYNATSAVTKLGEGYEKQGLKVVEGTPQAPGQVSLKYTAPLGQKPGQVTATVWGLQDTSKPNEPPAPLSPAQLKEKAKYNAKMLKEKSASYGQSSFELKLEAMKLEASGQLSKAKGKLAQIGTLEKYLVKYGITPEELSKLKDTTHTMVDTHLQAQRDHALLLATEAERLGRKLPGFVPGSAYLPWSANKAPGYKEAGDKLQEYENFIKDNAFIFKGVNTGVFRRQAKSQVDYEAWQSLQSIAQASAQKQPVTEEMTTKAKQLGVSDASIEAAKTEGKIQNLLITPPAFTKLADAKDYLSTGYTAYYLMKNYPGKEKYQMNAEEKAEQEKKVNDAHLELNAAKDAYLKAGGKAADFQELAAEGSNKAYEINYQQKNAKNIATNKASDEVKQASFDWHKAVWEYGKDSAEAKAADDILQAKQQAAKEYISDSWVISELANTGKANFEKSLEKQKNESQQKVKAAIYSYHYKNLMQGTEGGPTPEEVEQAKQEMEHAKETEKKWLPFMEKGKKMWLEEAEKGAIEAAQGAKKAQEALKNLGAIAQKTAADYDLHAADYHFFDDNSEERSQLLEHQKSQVVGLTSAERQTVKDYKDNDYKPINREVGGAASGTYKYSNDDPLSPSTRKKMENLDMTIAHTTLGQDMMLTRTMPAKYMWQGLGIQAPKDEAEAQALVGRLYTENAYSSTSTGSYWANSFANASDAGSIRINIRANKDIHGVMVEAVKGYDSEKEIILGRGTVYLIRGVKRDGYGGFIMDVDAVAQVPKKL